MAHAGALLQAVQENVHTDVILGWFVYGTLPGLQPTPQDELISSSMTAACNHFQQHACNLFAIVSMQQHHEDSSYNFQQRIFQMNRCSSM